MVRFSFFSCLRRLKPSWPAAPVKRVLLLGLDNAGKTTLCHLLTHKKGGGWPSRQPRPEHHVLHYGCTVDGLELRFVDPAADEKCCGEPRLNLWDDLLKSKPDAIIFIVDASDKKRHSVARDALYWTLRHPLVKEMPLLVLGSKIDLPTAIDTWDLKCTLGLAGLSDEQRRALLGQTASSTGMPYELRHRIAHFASTEVPPSPHHSGP